MTSAANPNVAGYFPENEELRVTSAPLIAASFYIGEQCMKQNDDFKLCKRANDNNPSACLKEGRRVTNCVQNIFYQLHEKCYQPFTKYWTCLDANNQTFLFCRDEEQVLEKCVNEHLGWHKRLWKANTPEAGFKEPGDLPGAKTWAYQHHVKNNKHDSS